MVRASSYLGSLAVLAASAVGKEIEPNADLAAELYDSGVIHEQIIASKKVTGSEQLNIHMNLTDIFDRPSSLARERPVPTPVSSTPSLATLLASTDGPRPSSVTATTPSAATTPTFTPS